jgi:hypothetical protein
MKFNREARRTAAQFLNGLAVAVVGTMVLGPTMVGSFNGVIAAAAIVAAGLLHTIAVVINAS